jgi:ABC-2 type transport system ATP-binding protein
MESSTNEAIVATNLAKRYDGGTEAVRGVSFRVGAGEIVGLLGPNGAGKSTTLNMLATLVAPSGGEARIFGRSIADREALRPLLGVALQASGVDPMMSVQRHFEVQAALYRMSARRARRRSRELVDAFDLAAVHERRAGELSGGTQRRLSLALALLHEPSAIVFDEPTTGLDPNAKRAVWALLADLRRQGLAILFSTHYMDEADRLCDRIEVIADGRIVASGTPATLKAEVTTGVLRLRVRNDVERAVGALELASRRGLLPPAHRSRSDHDVLQVQAELLDGSFVPLLALLLEEVGVDVVEMSWGHGTLDDVFARLGNGSADADSVAAVTIEHRAHARRGGGR